MTETALRSGWARNRRSRAALTWTVLVRVVARPVDLAVAEGVRRELLLEVAGWKTAS